MTHITERNQAPGGHLRLAMVQMTSSNRHADNVEAVHAAAQEAAQQGAHLLALPEAAGLMNRDRESARASVTTEDLDPYVAACKEIAREHGMWVQTGSTPVLDPPEVRFRNRGHLIDPEGRIVARYDKIHLFDVNLPGEPARRESDRYAPGEQAVIADTPWGRVGLSVCYDLRFPHLYREYARQGAGVMFIPSAFAMSTGEAHWEILLRARAIENGCFVVAAAQNGHHADGRQTWGHSMIIDPWGRVLADMKTGNGVTVLDLDMDAVTAARQSIPAIENERSYAPAPLL